MRGELEETKRREDDNKEVLRETIKELTKNGKKLREQVYICTLDCLINNYTTSSSRIWADSRQGV